MPKKSHTLSSVHRFLVYVLILSAPFPIYPIIATETRGVKPFIFVAALITFIGFLRFLNGAVLRTNRILNCVLAFYGAAAFSILGVISAGGGWKGVMNYTTLLAQLTIYIGTAVSVCTIKFTRKRVQLLLYILIGATVLVSVYSIYQTIARSLDWPFAYLTLYNPSLRPVEGAIQRGGQFGFFVRPSGFFPEPTRLGQFLLTPALLSIFLYTSAQGRKRKYLFYALILISAAFIFAFSMGGYVALGGAIIAGLLLDRVRWYSIRAIASMLAVITVSSLAFQVYTNFSLVEMITVRTISHLKIFGIESSFATGKYAATSVANRLSRMQDGLQIWMEHPLIGVGLNNFKLHYADNATHGMSSSIIQLLTEMGVFGLIIFPVLAFLPPFLMLKRQPTFYENWEWSAYTAIGLGLVGRGIWMALAGNYNLEFFWLDVILACAFTNYIKRR